MATVPQNGESSRDTLKLSALASFSIFTQVKILARVYVEVLPRYMQRLRLWDYRDPDIGREREERDLIHRP